MFEKIRRFFLHYGLSICVALTIMYLCMKPGGDMEMPHFEGSDKVGHALMYLGFTFCICINFFRQGTPLKSAKMAVWAIALPMLYGALIEVMQGGLTSTRSCDVWDWVADSAGSLIGYLAACYLVPRYFKENDY